ncbi:hypothetical protein DPMN_005399 [Dreissena polymorpha]|uniref:Uncharacterized protein n=1 Tax=Dreissena polymorpha TaxID=45954 RepID=A0A9D4RWJ3_DREPO|nr:hypothetical protein DPMN_005399 [Dreissena polymorpha]
MTELSKRHSVAVKEDGEDVFANSVLVRRDMATGINSFHIGQYLRARNICPSSLRIEFGDNGRVRFEFDMEGFDLQTSYNHRDTSPSLYNYNVEPYLRGLLCCCFLLDVCIESQVLSQLENI